MQLDLTACRGREGQTFTVAGDPPLPLELVEVRPLPAHRFRDEPFALTFHGPPDRPLPQGTFEVHHEELGTAALFLVPVAPDGSGAICYEAVFN